MRKCIKHTQEHVTHRTLSIRSRDHQHIAEKPRDEDSKCARAVIEKQKTYREKSFRFCKEICGKSEISNVEINSTLPRKVVYRFT